MNRDRLTAMQVPGALADLVLSRDFEPERPLLKNAVNVWGEGESLIVISGPTQIGKSIAAAVLAHDARSRGRVITALVNCDESEEGAYKACQDGVWYGYWIRDVKCQVGSVPLSGAWVHAPSTFDGLFLPAFWKSLEKAEVLVLDDLGLEPQTPNVKSRIIGALVARFDAGRRTVVTTNLDRAAFQAAYCSGPGARIAARLGNGWVQADGTGKAEPAQIELGVTT
jgi:hypothetical protein